MSKHSAKQLHNEDTDGAGTDRRAFVRKLAVGGVGTAAGVALLSERATAISATGGLYTALLAPLRAYDSRVAKYDTGNEGGIEVGPLSGGKTRSLGLGAGHDLEGNFVAVAVPPEATAAQINVTIVDTQGSGYLSLRAGNSGQPSFPVTSALINWGGPDVVVGNSTTIAMEPWDYEMDIGHYIDVICGPDLEGVSTEFIIDIFGYFAPFPPI